MTTRRRFFSRITAALGLIGLSQVPAVASVVSSATVPETSLDPKQLIWGTYGKGGDGPLRLKRLGDLQTDHLQNILLTEDWHIGQTYRDAICHILRERGVEPIAESVRCTTYEKRLAFQNSERGLTV